MRQWRTGKMRPIQRNQTSVGACECLAFCELHNEPLFISLRTLFIMEVNMSAVCIVLYQSMANLKSVIAKIA